ncbi:hypothetical protein FQN60_013439 [Etheostoma spectabile]|uniref:Uncharacterized protein n=1 Tax=Etheostoma spectabile TaxID=54343 RepID=A0A5J5CK25_9PERO|nr:hypothetical protein FQN60_013439 [Etheostoma spectabile]
MDSDTFFLAEPGLMSEMAEAADAGCCSLRLKDEGQTRVSRQPTGWDLHYPSTLQSLDRTLGTIPCDVTPTVKSFNSQMFSGIEPPLFFMSMAELGQTELCCTPVWSLWFRGDSIGKCMSLNTGLPVRLWGPKRTNRKGGKK